MSRTFLLTLLVLYAFLTPITRLSRAESNTIQITVGEFYFRPQTIQIKAGQKVRINLINKGKIEHEFMIGCGVEEGKSHMEMFNEDEREHSHLEKTENLHSEVSKRFEKDFFEGVEVVAQTEGGAEFMSVPGHGTMVRLKPESRATIAFTVPADHKGKWQMACFLPGHYEAKMKGEVIVK
jgi:uncharacterized cupredoxin-like copper-binding protein